MLGKTNGLTSLFLYNATTLNGIVVTSNTINASSINSSVPDVNTIDPIIIGDVQIGQPILPTDLGPESGKDFNTHPLLGDLSEIHPQIVNELYNNGVLPKVNQPALDPNQYSEDLDKLYDDIVNELVETKQIEYIEKLYNIDFEMIGYKRYRA